MRRALAGCLLATVFLTGCNQNDGPVLKGRLVANGQAYTPPGGTELKFLTVEGVGPGKKSYVAGLNKDGTFEVAGGLGRGVPPGQYRVIIQCDPISGADGRWTDPLRGAFTDKTSKLVYEVRPGVETLTIDLEKKTVE